jgi:hypothetical protein
MKIKEVFIALLIGCIMAFLFYLTLATIPDVKDRVSDKKIKARMAYHGVQVAFEDHQGRLYFIRNGKRCKL